jgi:hypothetical protein
MKKKFAEIHVKYPLKKKYETIIHGSMFINKTFKELTRHDVKYNMALWERIEALIPDSTSSDASHHIDSFYMNKNQIKYIIKHKLKSGNIHFLL